ncbi:hypothetical protein [Stenotrophomonas sp. SY1]|uniref:hypothetical protein n=1 Tax=Stenotrophomonas sp. SY1 TaxID=477235 RepID=UPI001E2B5176|nr:hypothetical protein [Stenotrophomonas sp. SY1]MCD9088326.1 hypothetical protein [Stenotrophomonas sp. SY1]
MFSLLARKPWYLLLLPAAVLLAVLGFRGGSGMQGADSREMAAAMVTRAPLSEDAGLAPASGVSGRERDTAIGPGLPLDLRAAFESGRDLFSYARQLRAAAAAGDAEAAWIVSRIYDYCGVYAMDPQGYALDSGTLASMGLKDVPGLVAARERVGSSCIGFTAADGLGSALILQQRHDAAVAGNLAAEAALLAMGEPLRKDAAYRRDLVERVLHSQDPEAFLAISAAMGVAAAGDDAYRGFVAGDQFSQLAWQLAACKLGLACGPDSSLMTGYCANGGICSRDPDQDFESFVYDAAVSRQGIERMNQLVDSLRKSQGGA